MKNRKFYALFILSAFFLTGSIMFAEEQQLAVYEVEPTVLTSSDFTGEYLIMTSDSNFVLGLGKPTLTSSLPMAKISIAKSVDNPSYYTVAWGTKYMSFAHKWDLEFVADDATNINWEIILSEGTDNVVMFKRAGEEKAIKYEGGVLYSDSNPTSENNMSFSLMKIKSLVSEIVTPDSAQIEYSNVVLDALDLTGEYVIETSTGDFMALQQDSKESAQYAFKFTKEDDFYSISTGDWFVSYFHNWNLTFMPKADSKYLWNIVVSGEGNDQKVTFQRSGNFGKQIKYEGGNFYTDGNDQNDILFTLYKVNTGTSLSTVKALNANVYYAHNGAIHVSSVEDLRTVRVYNLSGVMVVNSEINGINAVINTGRIKSGMYIVQVISASNAVLNQSIIIK